MKSIILAFAIFCCNGNSTSGGFLLQSAGVFLLDGSAGKLIAQ